MYVIYQMMGYHLSQVDADVFTPSLVQSAAVCADVDDGRVTRIVDQHLPSFLTEIVFLLFISQFDVQIIEHARRLDRTLICCEETDIF